MGATCASVCLTLHDDDRAQTRERYKLISLKLHGFVVARFALDQLLSHCVDCVDLEQVEEFELLEYLQLGAQKSARKTRSLETERKERQPVV